jgi:GTPase-associated protein 1, N-terminal domain type 2/GTPase-associated protein 1, middle domain
MTIRQLHYTSCRQGRDGIDGFQVAASTPGLAPRHEQLALPLAAYRPGPGAPPTPSPEQVAAFPVAFGYRRFDEVAVLFHSRYLGVDFSGRQGNYFAHVLVLDRPEADLAGLQPAEAWASPVWTSGPPGPPDLAVLEAPPAGPLADRGHVRAELARTPAFSTVLDAVVRALHGGPRVVVVTPDVSKIAVVLSAVTRSLPGPLAAEVSFTTFSSTPADADLLLVGTTPDVIAPTGAHGGRLVIRLDDASAVLSPYGDLVWRCWAVASGMVDELVELADGVHPALRPEELDTFAPFAELTLFGGSAETALGAVEFASRRHPAGLDGELWRRVDAAGVPGDVTRWSEAIRSTRLTAPDGPGPGLTAAYLGSVLSAVETGLVDPAGLWLPRGPAVQTAAGGWAVGAVRSDPSLATAGRVLHTASRLDVPLSDAELREIADLVLIPHLVDPLDAEAPGRIRELPYRDRLLCFAVEQLDRRLADDELFDAAARGLSSAAAQLLLDVAAEGSRCAVVSRLALARAGRLDRVETLRQVVGVDDAHRLARHADLIWSEPPSAAEATVICRSFLPAVITKSGLAAVLVRRLVADARDARTSPDVGALARALSAGPIIDALPPADAEVVRAARLDELFRDRPGSSADVCARAVEAARLAERVEPALGDHVAEAVAGWLLTQHGTALHAGVLRGTVDGPRADRFLSRYAQQLGEVLAEADPSTVAAILPAVAALARHATRARRLLDTVCVDGLRRRRKRDLDQIGRLLKDRREVLSSLPPPSGTDWPGWWDGWRAANLPPSSPGLRPGLPWRWGGR